MEAPSITKRILVSVLAIAMLMLSGTMAWAVAEDFDQAQTVPEGVRLIAVGGTPIDIGGMSADELRACITTSVEFPLMQPLNVRYGKLKFAPLNVRASKIVTIHVDAMVREAFNPLAESTLASRVMQSVSGATQSVDVKPQYAVDEAKVRRWVAGVAKKIDKKPVDAVLTVKNNRVYIKRSSTGASVDQKITTARMLAAIKSRKAPKMVDVRVRTLSPAVKESSFGKTIVVDRSQRRLYLYEGVKLKKEYRVAVGTPGFPTPLGEFKITLKRYLPTWSNPGSAWAADMPASIPPGPGNPLGTRAMNLNAPGIRIHGTNKVNSIGTAASHGCVRMLRSDVEALYEMVEVGTPVYIVP